MDELGLRRALGERMLPLMVAAISFLAAIVAAGGIGARDLAGYWRGGIGPALTVQVARPGDPAGPEGVSRIARTLAGLRADPAVASVEPLDDQALHALLRPWIGEGDLPAGLALPGVIAVTLQPGADPEAVAQRTRAALPDAEIDSHAPWLDRLSALARSLQACAWLCLAVCALVAVLVVAVATRAGLIARRETIRTVHGLGATDRYIVARFAGRATRLAWRGAWAGAALAVPVLLLLAALAAPLRAPDDPRAGAIGPGIANLLAEPLAALRALPADLWVTLGLLPPAAAIVGNLSARVTVVRWLRRLP